MTRLPMFLAAICVLASSAFADDDLFEMAMTRLPDRAPAPAFPDIPQVDMGGLCSNLSEVERFYPSRALRQGRAGRVVLDCTWGADGKAQACQVLYESPADFGFGDAAVRIACHFRVDVASFEGGEAVSNLPRDARFYRRNADGEPWRSRAPVRFQLR